jgi:hypothetical protein
MQLPRLSVLAGIGLTILSGLILPSTASSATPQASEYAPAKKAPQFKAGNAPGTAAPVYNQQRMGSTDPNLVAARNSPTPAGPQPLPNVAKPKSVKPTNPSANEARYLDQASAVAPRSTVYRRDERVQPASHPQWIDDPTLYEPEAGPNYGDGGCATCGPAGCGSTSCGGLSDCVPCNYFAQNGWYLGGDYVSARANFSDPAAIAVRTETNGGLNFYDRIVPYDTGYQSTFRVNAGYRWGACGESLNFSYFNFTDNSVVESPEVNAGVIVAGPFALNPLPGERLRTELDIEANVYDLDYAKRIPLCTSNSDPCGDGCCPPWAISWSAGARVGRLNLNSPTQLFDVNGALLFDALSEVSFVGAGPKVGLEGRRYLGEMQRWSVFGKSSLSLLLGQYDVEQRLITIGTGEVGRQSHNYTRIVPVLDLEVGLSRQLGKKTLLTAGYFMQAWIDVSTVNNLNEQGVGELAPANVDDANMTMFDGFMLRIERTF